MADDNRTIEEIIKTELYDKISACYGFANELQAEEYFDAILDMGFLPYEVIPVWKQLRDNFNTRPAIPRIKESLYEWRKYNYERKSNYQIKKHPWILKEEKVRSLVEEALQSFKKSEEYLEACKLKYDDYLIKFVDCIATIQASHLVGKNFGYDPFVLGFSIGWNKNENYVADMIINTDKTKRITIKIPPEAINFWKNNQQ